MSRTFHLFICLSPFGGPTSQDGRKGQEVPVRGSAIGAGARVESSGTISVSFGLHRAGELPDRA